MENLNAYILGLTKQAEKLAGSQKQLKDENLQLKTRNEELENAISRQKNVLVQLEEQNKVAKIANAVSDDAEDRKVQRKKLNELVREIDKCIALLNN